MWLMYLPVLDITIKIFDSVQESTLFLTGSLFFFIIRLSDRQLKQNIRELRFSTTEKPDLIKISIINLIVLFYQIVSYKNEALITASVFSPIGVHKRKRQGCLEQKRTNSTWPQIYSVIWLTLLVYLLDTFKRRLAFFTKSMLWLRLTIRFAWFK